MYFAVASLFSFLKTFQSTFWFILKLSRNHVSHITHVKLYNKTEGFLFTKLEIFHSIIIVVHIQMVLKD